ncbi:MULTISPECIES: hypothetical protein [Calothrix]|uniref:Uncharacterized protein n=2 Tax=Calothrix TaxID=1186 RepID=A0ABR8AH25_9CYAN|nr:MULTISPECIES: hypothetical protein [Calothrix]MBD2199326.1 hypothetical protein [Calothrix parietina FACHB-288]MBD2229417.1 hypothetical protein [Calothrix anomala FACHB-343]
MNPPLHWSLVGVSRLFTSQQSTVNSQQSTVNSQQPYQIVWFISRKLFV